VRRSFIPHKIEPHILCYLLADQFTQKLRLMSGKATDTIILYHRTQPPGDTRQKDEAILMFMSVFKSMTLGCWPSDTCSFRR